MLKSCEIKIYDKLKVALYLHIFGILIMTKATFLTDLLHISDLYLRMCIVT